MELEVNQVLKCEICGVVIEITSVGEASPTIVCCNQEMTKLEPQANVGENGEYKPVLTEGVYDTSIARVGVSGERCRDCEIKWIEIINDSYVNRKYLRADEEAEAHFYLPVKSGVYVRAYCTKHGLLQTEY